MEVNEGRKRTWMWATVIVLLIVQAAQALYMVHRESLTFDEDDHMFSGYMMWKTADYGLNPEHPPLAKLLATLPVAHKDMWVPKLGRADFKADAYLGGRDWLAHNDGASQRLVFRMRMAAELLAIGLALAVFVAARGWFGDLAGLIALALTVFDPNILAHSALVTTDVGVSLFFVASIYAFYRYTSRPGWGRLVFAGLMVGLLLATKHSGVLIAPMLVCLIAYEVFKAERGQRARVLGRLVVALILITVIGTAVLWSFYGFRYAARPAGLQLTTSLKEYAAPLSHFDQAGVMAFAHAHLLPESYLMGLVDVKRQAGFYPTYILGHVYSHGVWWYFPVAFLIKTTIGLMALLALAVSAMVKKDLKQHREVFYVLSPAVIYFAIAIGSGMNIGARHLLPVYALLIIFAAAGAARLSVKSRRWAVVCTVLVAAHIVSSLVVFPNEMAYANEAWGGAANAHRLLSDANVDWAQQLYQVKHWQDMHPNEDCWFAYFARPEVDPAVYGIRCHALPTPDTQYLENEGGGSELVPPVIQGTVIISAGDLSGCEWPSGYMNPYRDFENRKPDEAIDHAVFVYRGTFDMKAAAAESRAQKSGQLLAAHQPEQALAQAMEGVKIDPGRVSAQTAAGDAAAALGDKTQARQAYEAAISALNGMDENARIGYLADLKTKLAGVQ